MERFYKTVKADSTSFLRPPMSWEHGQISLKFERIRANKFAIKKIRNNKARSVGVKRVMHDG